MSLEVGASGRFTGIYHAHWEWARFEITIRSRWRRRLVRCQLESDEWPEQIAGRRDGERFAVTVDAEVVERGHFGHMSTLHWRLAVREWVSVKPLPRKGSAAP